MCSQANTADLNVGKCFKILTVFCGSYSMLRQRTRQRKVQQPAMGTSLEGGTPLQVTTIPSKGCGAAAALPAGNTMPIISSTMVTGAILKPTGHSSKSHGIHHSDKTGKHFNYL